MGREQAQHAPLREATRELAYGVWMGLCFLGSLWSRAIRKHTSGRMTSERHWV